MSISHIAVLGAGTMGHGIAHVSAFAGCEVRLSGIDDHPYLISIF